MNTVLLESIATPRTVGGRVRALAGLVQRLSRLSPRHSRKPSWVHMPDRAWRRHSALLTYLHEAQSGER